MKKSLVAKIVSLILMGLSVAIYFFVRQYIYIPRPLVVIVFVGVFLLSGYYIYFCNNKDFFEVRKEDDIVQKVYKNVL